MTYGSCRFLFHQFIQRDKLHKIIADADALAMLFAALVWSTDVNRPDQIVGGISGQGGNTPKRISRFSSFALLLHIHKIAVNGRKRNPSSLNDLAHAGNFIVFVKNTLMKSATIGFFDSPFLRIMAAKDKACF